MYNCRKLLIEKKNYLLCEAQYGLRGKLVINANSFLLEDHALGWTVAHVTVWRRIARFKW